MHLTRAAIATALAVVVFGAGVAFAQPPAAAAQKPAAAPTKYVAPVMGVAELAVAKPVTRVDQKANEVITVIKVKNLSTGAIIGLKVEEFWYDKANNPVTGGRDRMKKPLLPGDIATLELHTPKNPAMFRNMYTFTHQNGKIKTVNKAKIE
jgi:hypothetical protein